MTENEDRPNAPVTWSDAAERLSRAMSDYLGAIQFEIDVGGITCRTVDGLKRLKTRGEAMSALLGDPLVDAMLIQSGLKDAQIEGMAAMPESNVLDAYGFAHHALRVALSGFIVAAEACVRSGKINGRQLDYILAERQKVGDMVEHFSSVDRNEKWVPPCVDAVQAAGSKIAGRLRGHDSDVVFYLCALVHDAFCEMPLPMVQRVARVAQGYGLPDTAAQPGE